MSDNQIFVADKTQENISNESLASAKLIDLKKMLDNNLITQDEFDKKKNDILGKM